MPRLVIAYLATGICLFLALFSAFVLSGLARPNVTAESAEPAAASEPSAPSPADFSPPELESGRTYRISHDTPIYTAPDTAIGERQTLPAGGFFVAVQRMDSPRSWFEITVSDGRRDYQMFLLGADLRWKIVTPEYNSDEADQQRREAALRMLAGSWSSRFPVAEPPPPEPEPKTVEQWWAETSASLGGATAANMLASGIAAGGLTLITLCAIALFVVLRREHAWAQPLDDERELERQEEDDPFEFAQARPRRVGKHEDPGGE